MKNSTVRIWMFFIVAFFSWLMISIANELAEGGFKWYGIILLALGLGLLAVLSSDD